MREGLGILLKKCVVFQGSESQIHLVQIPMIDLMADGKAARRRRKCENLIQGEVTEISDGALCGSVFDHHRELLQGESN